MVFFAHEVLEVCDLLKQALDVLKKAESDAEQMVASARRRSNEMKKQAEEEKEAKLRKAAEDAGVKAGEIMAYYSQEAEKIAADAEEKAAEQAGKLAKNAATNHGKALNKAVERIVRRNGHR